MNKEMNINYSDECYTPVRVYEAVKKWVCEEYGINSDDVVRPFNLGDDYEKFPYREGCVVIDNPPFSILSTICAFYLDHGIKFFLFAPTLTAFGQRSNLSRMTVVIAGNNIMYEHSEKSIPTSYVTNCEDSNLAVRTAPELTARVEQALEETYGVRTQKVSYDYPANLINPAMLRKYCNYGIDLSIRRDECAAISRLDNQPNKKNGVYGGGLLVSNRVAAICTMAEPKVSERSAEQSTVIKVELSQREEELVSKLSK